MWYYEENNYDKFSNIDTAVDVFQHTSFHSETRCSTKLKTLSQSASEMVSNKSDSRINSVDVEQMSTQKRQTRPYNNRSTYREQENLIT